MAAVRRPAGAITLNSGNIDLTATVTLDGGTAGEIIIGNAVGDVLDADTAGLEGLNIISGDGDVTVYSDFGSAIALGAVDVDSTDGTLYWNGDIQTREADVDFSGVVAGTMDVTGNDGGDFVIDTDDNAGVGNGGAINLSGVTLDAGGIGCGVGCGRGRRWNGRCGERDH